MFSVGEFVAPVKLRLPIRSPEIPIVIVLLAAPKLLASKTPVSCGNGNLEATAPPDVVNQSASVMIRLSAPACTQYAVTGVVCVIDVLPPQLPIDVPVNGAAAPAAVMSSKSTFVSATTAAVMVRAVPSVSDAT